MWDSSVSSPTRLLRAETHLIPSSHSSPTYRFRPQVDTGRVQDFPYRNAICTCLSAEEVPTSSLALLSPLFSRGPLPRHPQDSWDLAKLCSYLLAPVGGRPEASCSCLLSVPPRRTQWEARYVSWRVECFTWRSFSLASPSWLFFCTHAVLVVRTFLFWSPLPAMCLKCQGQKEFPPPFTSSTKRIWG